MRDVQVTLRNEIRIMCEYRSYENSDYMERLLAELSAEKLDCLGNRIQHLQQILGNDGDDENDDDDEDGNDGDDDGGVAGGKEGVDDGDSTRRGVHDGTKNGNKISGEDGVHGSLNGGEGPEEVGVGGELNDSPPTKSGEQIEDDIGLPSMFLSMLPVAREDSPS
ncbi:hypothetical protein CLOP_g13654 [Closterium sp. NIES-67]|nr:hypothetical protein CLOP_g13654 [Closterium sp. NIES-67]